MTAEHLSLSPAAQFLLLTAAPHPNDTAIRESTATGIDWREVCALAQREKAASIVWRRLEGLAPAAPAPGRQDLRQLATFSVMQMLQLEQLLFRTLDSLAERGIEAMLLKGAGLAYTAYSSFADRPMGDVDLLLQPEQAAQAWEVLQHQGWTWPSTRWAAGQYTAHQHLPPLLWEPGGFRLEIHHDVLPEGHPFQFGAATLWERARTVRRNGRGLTVPHPLHQLWHVCVHFAWQHQMGWGAWRALRDCGAIIQGDTLDWREFAELARSSRAGTCCFWTLRLARRLASAAVPENVLTALRPPHPEWMLEGLERHYVSNLFPSRNQCPSVWLKRRLWELGILPRWSRHGRARPWQVMERWLQGSEDDGSEERRHLPFWDKLGHFPASVTYLRRIHRFALPGQR